MQACKFKIGDWVVKREEPPRGPGYIGQVTDIEHVYAGRGVYKAPWKLRFEKILCQWGWIGGHGDSEDWYRLATTNEIVHARLGLFPMVGSKHE